MNETIKTLIAGAVLIVVGMVLGFMMDDCASDEPPKQDQKKTAQVDQIEEDEPGWDCRIHGNRICGPTAGQGVGK